MEKFRPSKIEMNTWRAFLLSDSFEFSRIFFRKIDIMSRTALDGFPFGEVENGFPVSLIQHKNKLYFTEILGFCCMGNHFHLLVRMLLETNFSDHIIKKRYFNPGIKTSSPQAMGIKHSETTSNLLHV